MLQVELGNLNGYTWLADNRLAFAPAEGGLALLNPEDLASRTFMVGAEQPVSLPVQRADGRLAFFIHDETITQPGYLYAGDPTDLSFSAVSASPVITTGMLWNPSGTRLVRPGITGPGLILMLDPATGAQTEYEVPTPVVAFDWGDAPPASDTPFTLSADLYYLAPQAGIVQVWRVPANGEAPQAITSAPTDVLDYDVSLDGAQVVYSSGGGLYRQVIGTADLTELARLPDPATGASPSFSLTGGMVAFSSGGIWIVPSTSPQEARRLVADSIPQAAGQVDLIQRYSRPRWSPDGLWLSAHVTFFEGSDVALIPVNEPGVASQPLLLNLFGTEARWMPDNTVLVYSPGGPYSEPRVTRVQPSDPLSISRIIDLPVLDVRLMDDARLALLRLPTPYGIGPNSVSVVSIQPSGGDLRQETGAVVLTDPALAPGGNIIAGLMNIRTNGDGPRAGQLVVTDPARGVVYTVPEAAVAWSLQWGGQDIQIGEW
ncbi:MAG: hypothetical protein IT326_08600 [Anaerolineae bacterium]|nr:hypothetical protein [Anaerolineae bacterium]